MYIVRIEHEVPNYEGWKKAFDSDPAGREKSGVNSYSILRDEDNPNYVMIDLEFDELKKAEAFLETMRRIWNNVQGKIIEKPKARIVRVEETTKY